jgi:hypothetical protein
MLIAITQVLFRAQTRPVDRTLARGSSGFGEASSSCSDRHSVRTCNAGDHLSLRMSRQMRPRRSMLGLMEHREGKQIRTCTPARKRLKQRQRYSWMDREMDIILSSIGKEATVQRGTRSIGSMPVLVDLGQESHARRRHGVLAVEEEFELKDTALVRCVGRTGHDDVKVPHIVFLVRARDARNWRRNTKVRMARTMKKEALLPQGSLRPFAPSYAPRSMKK